MSKPASTKASAPEALALRPKEAGRLIGVGQTTLYAALKSGLLPCKRLGGATLIMRDDLEKFVAGLPSGR